MSEMLEQAIIDADALKQAAVKNAETLVLEKFSNQIRDAVDILLEQEDPLAAMPEGEDPMAVIDEPTDELADEDFPVEEVTVEEKSSVLEHIPLAVTSENNEQIEIPLDKLMEELSAINESFRFNGDTHNDPDLLERNLLEVDEAELQETSDDDTIVEDIYEDEEGPDDDEDLDLDEGLLDKIGESLKVDMQPTKSGWVPNSSDIVLAEEELLALEQDSEIREERAAMRKAVRALETANESLTKKNSNLVSSVKGAKSYILKSRDTIRALKEKLDAASLMNAKLIYQNKALISDSLNERQKNKLAEAISSAETIEEAKVIFETLQSTVGSTSRNSQPKSLSEAVEKTSSMILSSRKENSVEQKRDPTLSRWKFLAGIEKQ